MKILLHICCANCAIFPVKLLREANHSVTGFFYNPNIHPYIEYRKRLESVHDYAKATQLEVLYQDEYGLEDFLAQVAQDPATRCGYCYESRLRRTAEFAATNGYDAFGTSLLASPYQDHEAIRAFGRELGKLFNVSFLYEDFSVGWQEALKTSHTMGLYQQVYCGCIYSEKDSFYPKRTN
jgi:predicted adenine nucleotide alpha hydrolase (AANH) superfamily ATPase